MSQNSIVVSNLVENRLNWPTWHLTINIDACGKRSLTLFILAVQECMYMQDDLQAMQVAAFFGFCEVSYAVYQTSQ